MIVIPSSEAQSEISCLNGTKRVRMKTSNLAYITLRESPVIYRADQIAGLTGTFGQRQNLGIPTSARAQELRPLTITSTLGISVKT
jgi:hypothetical protein